MNLEGKLLGNRYEIIEKVGNGGMATVYKATDNILKRPVAVKILRDEFTTDDEFIRRFEAEAQSAARLTHANIVSIYDVGKEGNLYYIVMELIQGKTLKEIIIEEKGPLPWKWSVNVAIQIAQALEMAHRNNIIHRDIKPHNIIITEDGVAKVTDFGIAKAVSNSTITAFGTTIGSVHYFSPEHARGGYTDAKSDLYSLGVVMYEMLTGRVPFDADTPVSVALKHMQEEPVEPIELNPNLPSSVNKIIMKALKKDATLRYQTSTEMLRDLKASLKNPDGDFVEEKEYDKTAITQKIDTSKLDEDDEEDDEEEERGFKATLKKHKVAFSILGIIILFLIAFGTTMVILGITNPKEVTVPNIIGLTQQEAKQKIKDANLVYEVEGEEYNKDVENDKIISLRTEIGEQMKIVGDIKVKEKSKIFVIVSKGQEKTTVPNVKGKTREEAISLIEEAKLKAEIVEENSKTVQENCVISQETEENTEVFAGDTVKLHVSIGAEKVTMISVIDKDEEEAKKALKDIGITNINIAYEEDSSKASGKVIKQSIESGSSVEKEASITITVNTYKEVKTVSLIINVKSLTGGYVASIPAIEPARATVEAKVKTIAETKTNTNNKNEVATDSNKTNTSTGSSEKQGNTTGTTNTTNKNNINNTGNSTNTTNTTNTNSPTTNENKTPVEKTVNVTVSVDGAVVETRTVDKNETQYTVELKGNGSKSVKVKVGNYYEGTKTINFDTTSKLEIK